MKDINIKLQNKIGIYIITNIENGKRYIGSSINLYDRLHNHIWDLDKNRHCNNHLQNAWNKYGKDSFEYGILEFCSSDNQFERECFYINSLNPEYNFNGVNLDSVNKHSEETKLKISNSIKQSYQSGKLKERLDKSVCRNTPCFIYDIIKWELVKECKNFKEADDFLQMDQAVRFDKLNNRIYKDRYVISDLKKDILELKLEVCKNILTYNSKDPNKKYFIAEIDNDFYYFKNVQSFVNNFHCSSSSTLKKHSDATLLNPYIIPNTNIKIFYSKEFIGLSRSNEESLEELSGNIGEK